MSRTNQQRYAEALAHIKKVNNGLATDVGNKVGGNSLTAGGDISLGGAGYWHSGTPEQHTAVRALLLCHVAYYRPPHSNQDFASVSNLTGIRTRMLGKTVQQVGDEIKLFLPGTNRTLNGLATAAQTVTQTTGVVDHFVRTRTDRNVSSSPVCYHGVVSWLFASGFVSKRWLAREANTLNAYSANRYLGAGEVVSPEEWDSVPQGYIWNIHRVNDPTTCHWGVSLGNDVSAACNNTDESPRRKLKYISGDTRYGTFKLSEICSVLNRNTKYGAQDDDDRFKINLVLRKINPLNENFY